MNMIAKTVWDYVNNRELCIGLIAQHDSPKPRKLTIRRGRGRGGDLIFVVYVQPNWASALANPPVTHEFTPDSIKGPITARLHRCQNGRITLCK